MRTALLSLALGAASSALAASISVLPLGDSITYGYGSSDGNGYREEFYNRVVEEGNEVDMVGSLRSGDMSDPDNEGHSGWTIDQIAGAASAITYLDPTYVLLHAGTNDLNGISDADTAAQRYAALVDQLVTTWPDATIMVAQIIPSTISSTQANIDAFNAQVPDIVDSRASEGQKVQLVDMADAISTSDLGDTLHPNDEGYVKMGDVWADAVLSNLSGQVTRC